MLVSQETTALPGKGLFCDKYLLHNIIKVVDEECSSTPCTSVLAS